MREVEIGDVYKNRQGDIVRVIDRTNDLVDVEIIFTNTPDHEGYNFWGASGSRTSAFIITIPTEKEDPEDVMIDKILSKEDYPEYYL